MKNNKNKLPLSFILFFIIFGIGSVVSLFTFIKGFILIGPWTHLMICVAFIGLLLTVLVACIKWKWGKRC